MQPSAVAPGAAWAAVMAMVLGLLVAADYGVLASTHHTLSARTAQAWAGRWKCPPDELEEERVSLAECHAMAARVEGLVVSRPEWFAPWQIVIGIAGALLGLASAAAAIGFIDRRHWASPAFLAALAGLMALEILQLLLASLTGPLLRFDHLWKYSVWLMIHVGVITALFAGTSARLRGAANAEVVQSRSAAMLHYVLAASMFFLYPLSWWLVALPWGHARGFPTQLHKNLGITVVIVLVALFFCRQRPAGPPDEGPRWMAGTARTLRVFLYLLVLLCAVSGYLSSAFSGWTTRFWWLVDLPHWGREDEDLNALFSDLHVFSAWLLLGVVVTHVAGALYHALRDDGVVRRMLHW